MSQAVSTEVGGHAVRVEDVPDPQVSDRASRRTYTARYKLDVLPRTSGRTRPARVPWLRREGLYTSLISAWREQRDKGALAALAAARGPKPADPAAAETARLAAENARLAAELDTARTVIRGQGELSALLQQLSAESADRHESEPNR